MKTAEQVKEDRLSAALAACFDTRMGTLWRVREDLWASQLAAFVEYEAKRQWHPGLSLRSQPVTSVHEYIPMLHGTTGNGGPVVVKGITRHRGPDHATSFGRIIRPAAIAARETVEDHGTAPPDMPDHDLLTKRRVVPNHDKPRLDPSEMQALLKWAQEKVLL